MTDWIKCSERLPEPFVDVLVWCKNNDGIGFTKGEKYLGVDRWVVWNDGYPPGFNTTRYYGSVSHWMPLPKTPEET